jgi:hypothetical protein
MTGFYTFKNEEFLYTVNIVKLEGIRQFLCTTKVDGA